MTPDLDDLQRKAEAGRVIMMPPEMTLWLVAEAREAARLRGVNAKLVKAVEFGLSRFCDPQKLLDDPAAERFKAMGESALTDAKEQPNG